MSTNHDKRELLKLKQGLIEDSEVIKREEQEKIVLHGKKKFENFWYHNKVAVLLGGFFAALAIFFAVDMLTQKKADINYMFVATSVEASYMLSNYDEGISRALAFYTPNFDGNSYVYTQIFPVDAQNQSNPDVLMANRTKLFAEMQLGAVRLIIGNRDAFSLIMSGGGEEMVLTDVFVDLKSLYPRNENIVEDVLYRLEGSAFMEAAGVGEYFWEYTDDLYIALLGINTRRSAAQVSHERSLEVLDNIIRNNVVTSEDIIANRNRG
jgi:hypothetical protein